MTKNNSHALSALAAAALLSGCMGPAYHRPDVETPAAFKEMPKDLPQASSTTWRPASPNDAAPRGSWWALFGDPRLDELEGRVLVSNQSLKQSQAQFREALEIV